MTKFGKKDKNISRIRRASDCGYETWEQKHFCFTDLFRKPRKTIIIIL